MTVSRTLARKPRPKSSRDTLICAEFSRVSGAPSRAGRRRRERERKRERVCVCVRERERERMRVRVCERESGR